MGWILPEMVEVMLYLMLVGRPQYGDWRGDGMMAIVSPGVAPPAAAENGGGAPRVPCP